MKLKVKSQLPLQEGKGGWVDDCGPTSLAMAIGWASGYALDPNAKEAHSVVGKAGRVDRIGQGDSTSYAQLIKAAKLFGGSARYAKSWEDVTTAAKKGAAIIINVQAPKNYPASALAVNAFARKRVGKTTYGHYGCAAWDAELKWQFADPTQTAKGKEKNAALVTQAEVRALASSKGDKAGPHVRCIIVTFKKVAAPTPEPAPVVKAPAPTPAPVAPVAPAPKEELTLEDVLIGVPRTPRRPRPKTPRSTPAQNRFRKLFNRIVGRIAL